MTDSAPLFWRRILSKKCQMWAALPSYHGATEWWVTGYNRPGKFVACRMHDEVAEFDTELEARQFAEATYLLEDGDA